MLKPQDLLVLLKLATHPPSWTFDSIAHELNLSQSSVHRSVQRAANSGLYDPRSREVKPTALFEFLIHGVKYVFPPEWEGEARGIPTAWAAPPLSKAFPHQGGNIPVWPDSEGKARGIALEPLHPAVVGTVRWEKERRKEKLWELLSLLDGIRIGNAREREWAEKEMKKRLLLGA
jgi:hypothetical protein